MLAMEFPHVVVVLNRDNRGFAAANNQGIFRARGRHVLLVNSDTEIIDDALEKSVEFMRTKPMAGIVGCRLLYPDGKSQPSVYSFPDLWNLFCEMTFLYRAFPNSRLFGRYYMSYFNYAEAGQVGWLSGAFFLIHRDVIEKIGLLDEQFFMYSEEMDYCLRAARAGFETWYTPSATVVHHWLTVNKVTSRGLAWVLLSQLLYFEKHFSGFRRFAMKALRVSGIVLRLLIYPIVGAIGMRKSIFHEWKCLLTALWKVSRSGIHYGDGQMAVAWIRFIEA
jgi:GT2 family glycosyltransferase